MRAGRRELLIGAGLASLAWPRPALAAGASDADRLERLLALERRLQTAYAAALERDAVDRALGERLLGHEREHVRALEQTLRRAGRKSPSGAPPAPPEEALSERRAFGRHALRLEQGAVGAYQDALAALRDERLLQPLGSIMAAGAQHEVALRQVLGIEPLAVL